MIDFVFIPGGAKKVVRLKKCEIRNAFYKNQCRAGMRGNRTRSEPNPARLALEWTCVELNWTQIERDWSWFAG
jgi:hypothetical protein